MFRSLLSELRVAIARFGRQRADRSRYRDAVATLPCEQRRVFLLHRVDELPIAEIAGRLGLSTSDVERLLAEALHTIAHAIVQH